MAVLLQEGESAVVPSKYLLLAFGIVLLGSMVSGGASAEDDRWNKIDLKPLVPPVLPPLPPNSQLAPGGVGDPPPYSSAPPTMSSQAPSTGGGIRLTVPSR